MDAVWVLLAFIKITEEKLPRCTEKVPLYRQQVANIVKNKYVQFASAKDLENQSFQSLKRQFSLDS